jgi:hypothetical protein
MYVPFCDINPESRVWIYNADRVITSEEADVIMDILKDYLDNWKSESGISFPSSAEIFENWFVVIVMDTTEAIDQYRIGPIDNFVYLFKDIGKLTDIDFFAKPLFNYIDNGEVKAVSLFKVKQAVADGIIKPDTVIFDHARVEEKAHLYEFERWKVRAADSWISTYFQQHKSPDE